MAMLRDNWDGYGAVPLPRDTLYKAQRLIHVLNIQPEIFPTADGSIQMEFEKDNGDYLEFQFTGKGTCEVFRLIGGKFSWPVWFSAARTSVLHDNCYNFAPPENPFFCFPVSNYVSALYVFFFRNFQIKKFSSRTYYRRKSTKTTETQ